jgi:hypothetical protein
MHAVGGRSGVEDVIVAEDFTFAPSSVMGDDVAGLWFPACDAVEALTFLAFVMNPTGLIAGGDKSLSYERPSEICSGPGGSRC